MAGEAAETAGRRKRRRWSRIAILLSIFSALLLLNLFPGCRSLFRNAIYSCLPTAPKTIELSGSPREMGVIHGKERSWAVGALCDIYIKGILCGGDESILKKREKAAVAVFDSIAPRWGEEIAGIAEGAGVDVDTLKFGNVFLDLGSCRAGCREVVAFGKASDGSTRLLHAHNLDWDNLGGIGNFIVTIFRAEASEGRFATVRMGFPGMVGALTIINEKGVSLGFNQLGLSNGDMEGAPVFVALRDIAETCADFDAAEKRILSLPKGMPFCIVLADAVNAKAAVYERWTNGTLVSKRSAVDGVVAADNSPWCGSGMAGCPVDAVARSAGIFSGGVSGDVPVERLKGVLRDPRVLLECDIYSVIFDYARNRMYLAAGRVPAARGEYFEYDLFDKGSSDAGENP